MKEENELEIIPAFNLDSNDIINPVEITKKNEGDLNLTSKDSPDVEGIVLLHTKNGKTWEWEIGTIKKWPEIKRATCHKEIHLPWCDRERIPYPCLMRRTCTKTAYIRVTYSGSDLDPGLEKAIKSCAKFGLAAALPLALIGQFAAAGVAFVEAMKSCLIAKGIKFIGRFNVGVYTKKSCSDWKRV